MTRIIETPWGMRKPPYGTKVNHSHALAAGLATATIMNEGAGTTTFDAAKDNYLGTFASSPAWAVGQFGAAIDTTGGYIVTRNWYSNLPSGTISFWAKPSLAWNDSTRQYLFGTFGSGGAELCFQTYFDNNFYIGWNAAGDSRVSFAKSSTNWVQNTWQMYTYTWVAGSPGKVYRNGLLIGTGGANTAVNTVANPLWIGNEDSGGSGNFPGLIDVFLGYSRDLSPGEIQQLYAEPFCFMEQDIIIVPNTVAGGATTHTKTYTIDSLLLKTQTKTHTVDSLLKATFTKTYTVDSLLKATKTVNHSIDSLLKGTLTKTHSVDSLLKGTLTKTHSIDSLLKGTLQKTYTVDSYLQAAGTVTKTYTVDSLLKKTQTLSNTVDSLLLKTSTKSHTVDSLLKKTQAIAHSVDSLLKGTIQKTYTVDSLLKQSRTNSHTVDSLLSIHRTLQHTVDSFLRATFTKTHSVDSLLKGTLTKTYTVDSYLIPFGTVVEGEGQIINHSFGLFADIVEHRTSTFADIVSHNSSLL